MFKFQKKTSNVYIVVCVVTAEEAASDNSNNKQKQKIFAFLYKNNSFFL